MTYQETVEKLNDKLRVDASFDLIHRPVSAGGRRGTLYCVDGFTKDEVLEKMLEFLSKLPAEDVQRSEERR